MYGRACGCVEGHRRCPKHAVDYAREVMRARKWAHLTVPPDLEDEAVTRIRSIGRDIMRWAVGLNKNNTIKEGWWCPDDVALVVNAPVEWLVRLQFLSELKYGSVDRNFVDAIRAAHRLSGDQGVADLLEQWWAELGLLAGAGAIPEVRWK